MVCNTTATCSASGNFQRTRHQQNFSWGWSRVDVFVARTLKCLITLPSNATRNLFPTKFDQNGCTSRLASRKLYFGVERRRSDGNNRFSTYRMKMGQLAVTGTAAVDNYRKREFSKGLSFSWKDLTQHFQPSFWNWAVSSDKCRTGRQHIACICTVGFVFFNNLHKHFTFSTVHCGWRSWLRRALLETVYAARVLIDCENCIKPLRAGQCAQ